MLVMLYGLPGSGRRSFIETLKLQKIDYVFYEDFQENNPEQIIIDLVSNKDKLVIFSTFATNTKIIFDQCIPQVLFLGIIFERVLKKIEDERYNEFFGVDLV